MMARPDSRAGGWTRRAIAWSCAGTLVLLSIACGTSNSGYTLEEAARARTSIETVQMRDLMAGAGESAERGRRLVVHYSGWLYDPDAPEHRGRPFDSSLTRGQPFDFVLGAGNVIPGWERGTEGMRVGGKRELTIPARLAYGPRGAPPVIPPDATLVFEIELIDVR